MIAGRRSTLTCVGERTRDAVRCDRRGLASQCGRFRHACEGIASFLEKNPQGGQHHVCYEVPEIYAAKAWFESQGKRVLGEPRIGAHGTLIFFVHPRDMQGVLTEIMETPKGAH